MTAAMLHNVFEFNNTAFVLKMKGRCIRDILRHSAESYGKGGWLQVTGIRYTVDIKNCKSADKNARCIGNITIDGKPLKDDKTYFILTNDFLARGGNGYVWFKKCAEYKTDTYTTFYSIVRSYIRRKGGVFKQEKKDGRVGVIK